MAESQASNPHERLAAALAYVFTPVVPLVLLAGSAKNSPFLKKHSAQALIWSVVMLVLLVGTVIAIIAMLRSTWLAICLLPLVTIVPFLPGAFIARLVYRGQDVRLPLVTPLAERLFPARRF